MEKTNEVAADSTQQDQPANVEYFNRRALRRLYKSGSPSQGATGAKNIYKMSLNLSMETYEKLSETVKMGKGSYGAPTIELAVRVLLSLVGQVGVDEVGAELALAGTHNHYIVTMLRRLADAVELNKDK